MSSTYTKLEQERINAYMYSFTADYYVLKEMKCVALRVDKIYEQLIADFITNCKNYYCFPLFSCNLNMHLLLYSRTRFQDYNLFALQMFQTGDSITMSLF